MSGRYMLISVREREIVTEIFDCWEDAFATMLAEFSYAANISIDDCTEDETEKDDEFGYCKWNAYVSESVVDGCDYDWLIVSLDGKGGD